MAQRTQIVLIDDLDGTEIKDGEAQSITFTWSGVDYSIDLSKANADKFVKAIGPYLEKAQRVVAARVVVVRLLMVVSPKPDVIIGKERGRARNGRQLTKNSPSQPAGQTWGGRPSIIHTPQAEGYPRAGAEN